MSRSTFLVVALVTTTGCLAFGCGSTDKKSEKKPASGESSESSPS